jgi:hypothetical protein
MRKLSPALKAIIEKFQRDNRHITSRRIRNSVRKIGGGVLVGDLDFSDLDAIDGASKPEKVPTDSEQ